MRGILALSLLLALAGAAGAEAPAPSPARQRILAAQEAALALEFKGITSDGQVLAGLYRRRASASLQPARAAAGALLQALDDGQRAAAVFPVDAAQWRRWSNAPPTIYDRNGVRLADLTDGAREQAVALLRASLSERGWREISDLMRLDPYGSGSFWLAILGTPSPTRPWGWQLQGHHLVINCLLVGDQLVMTPLFMGAEPVTGTAGKAPGLAFLQAEQDQAAALLNSLTAAQRGQAVIAAAKTGPDIVAEAFKDNEVIAYAGLRAADMTRSQRRRLLALIGEHVSVQRPADARARLAEVRRHLDDTYFAWVGASGPDDAFYYRIHSPVILIEFDHQPPFGLKQLEPGKPTREHIHSVLRTPNGNDYGKALLRLAQ